MAPIRSRKPTSETPPIRPGWTKRIQMPISTAIGMVETTVNMPQGLLVSALTTISASTARMMIMIMKQPKSAIRPAISPISVFTISPSDRPSRRVEMNRIMKSWTAPASTTPTRIHSMPGR